MFARKNPLVGVVKKHDKPVTSGNELVGKS
jgi:hypothetical protein